MAELKQALSYQDQIKRLVSKHNLKIDNNDAALEILKKVNYYRLSGYGIGLKKKNNWEEYREEITLEWLFDLYCFDSKFKNDLIQTIEHLEIQFRTQISYQLAMNYGADGYLNPDNFIRKENHGKDIHEITLEKFRNEVIRQQKVPFVRHHLNKYCGRFPIWVATELFSFGMLTSLFSILKENDRKAIAALYDAEPDHLNSWMLSLLEVRNICAHYTRLYNLPLKQTPHLYKENMSYRQKINKIFPVLLVIKRILNSNDQWRSFLRDIEDTIHRYEHVICFPFMGFPKDWKEVLSAHSSRESTLKSTC